MLGGQVAACYVQTVSLIPYFNRSAHLCSRYKAPIPIIAITRFDKLARQLHLYRGVFPVLYPHKERDPDWTTDIDKRINYGIQVGKERGFIHTGDFVITKHFKFLT